MGGLLGHGEVDCPVMLHTLMRISVMEKRLREFALQRVMVE